MAELSQASRTLGDERWRRVREADVMVRAARVKEAAMAEGQSMALAIREVALDHARSELKAAERALFGKGPERASGSIAPFAIRANSMTSSALGFSARSRMAAAAAADLLAACRTVSVELVSKPRRAGIGGANNAADPNGMLPASLASDTGSAEATAVDGDAVAEAAQANGDEDEAMERRIQDAEVDAGLGLPEALRELAASFQGIKPRNASIPTVLVAGNEPGMDTASTVLELGIAAAELGARVLLIEASPARSSAMETLVCEGDPLLIEAFGSVRIVMAWAEYEGVFCAPFLKDGARIAAALARNAQAILIEDLADEFDLVLVDGGRAGDSARDGWSADAYLRVARFASYRDDDRFLAAFEAEEVDFLGTVTGSAFVEKRRRRPIWRNVHVQTSTPGSQRAPSGAAPTVASRPPVAVPSQVPFLRAVEPVERDTTMADAWDGRAKAVARQGNAPAPILQKRRAANR